MSSHFLNSNDSPKAEPSSATLNSGHVSGYLDSNNNNNNSLSERPYKRLPGGLSNSRISRLSSDSYSGQDALRSSQTDQEDENSSSNSNNYHYNNKRQNDEDQSQTNKRRKYLMGPRDVAEKVITSALDVAIFTSSAIYGAYNFWRGTSSSHTGSTRRAIPDSAATNLDSDHEPDLLRSQASRVPRSAHHARSRPRRGYIVHHNHSNHNNQQQQQPNMFTASSFTPMSFSQSPLQTPSPEVPNLSTPNSSYNVSHDNSTSNSILSQSLLHQQQHQLGSSSHPIPFSHENEGNQAEDDALEEEDELSMFSSRLKDLITSGKSALAATPDASTISMATHDDYDYDEYNNSQSSSVFNTNQNWLDQVPLTPASTNTPSSSSTTSPKPAKLKHHQHQHQFQHDLSISAKNNSTTNNTSTNVRRPPSRIGHRSSTIAPPKSPRSIRSRVNHNHNQSSSYSSTTNNPPPRWR